MILCTSQVKFGFKTKPAQAKLQKVLLQAASKIEGSEKKGMGWDVKTIQKRALVYLLAKYFHNTVKNMPCRTLVKILVSRPRNSTP